jgi:hypothetical protein
MRKGPELMSSEEMFVRISNGLSRRLELLEARSAGAPPPAAVLVAPHGEAETAAFEIAPTRVSRSSLSIPAFTETRRRFDPCPHH